MRNRVVHTRIDLRERPAVDRGDRHELLARRALVPSLIDELEAPLLQIDDRNVGGHAGLQRANLLGELVDLGRRQRDPLDHLIDAEAEVQVLRHRPGKHETVRRLWRDRTHVSRNDVRGPPLGERGLGIFPDVMRIDGLSFRPDAAVLELQNLRQHFARFAAEDVGLVRRRHVEGMREDVPTFQQCQQFRLVCPMHHDRQARLIG